MPTDSLYYWKRMDEIMIDLILASQSPRRREILENLGFSFRIVTSEADETCAERDPRRFVETLALRKANAVYEKMSREGSLSQNTLILAADTVVAAGNEILGKPRDRADADRMLRLLSGTTHHVISGIALLSPNNVAVSSEVTGVRFSPLTESDIALYVASDEPYDKAGAYAVQGMASLWIEGLEGDYFNVVGLPVKRMHDMLRDSFGIDPAPLVFKR